MHTKWLPPWHLKATPSGVKQDISQAYHCVLVGPPPIHLANLGPHKKKPILLLVQCTVMVIHRSMFCYLTLKGGKKKKKKLVVKEARGPIIWDRAQCPCGHDDCCVPPHRGAARVTNLVEHDILALGCPRQGR